MHFAQLITYFELMVGIYILLILIFLIIIYLIVKSIVQHNILLQKNKWDALIDQEIYEAILLEEDEYSSTEFENYVKSNAFKRHFIKRLVKAEQNFVGQSKDKIRDLFNKYNLEKISLNNLNCNQSHLIAEAIQELTAMKVKEALPRIQHLLTHKDELVKLEAQYGVVKFMGYDGLYFLDQLTIPISEWHQQKILNAIHLLPTDKGNRIETGLNSSNQSIAIFTLKLIRKFQLFEYHQSLEELYIQANDTVKFEILKTLVRLENHTTSAFLINQYPSSTKEIKSKILNALEAISHPNDHLFLKTEAIYGETFSIKKAAIKALKRYHSLEEIKDFLSGDNSEEIQQIINQITQEY